MKEVSTGQSIDTALQKTTFKCTPLQNSKMYVTYYNCKECHAA